MEKQKFYEMRSSVQREGLEDMISWINNITSTKDLVLLEIGSYVGESTVMFAENFKQVISIDPFVDNYDPTDLSCAYAPFNEVYEEFLKTTLPYPNIKSIRETSKNAYLSGHDYGWGNIRHSIGQLLDDKVDATFKDGSWIRKL